MEITRHAALYFTAFILFILAGCPTGLRVKLEWFAFAALVLTLLV